MQPLFQLSLNRNAESPLYLQIANQIISLIQHGVLKSGTRLPGSRELSISLKVHRKTVVWAYDELQAQGWIETFPRRGVFVSGNLPVIRPVKLTALSSIARYPKNTQFTFSDNSLDLQAGFPVPKGKLVFDPGFPDVRLTPIDLLMREFRSISKRGAFKNLLMYGHPAGAHHLRDALAIHLSETRGLQISAENILITSGAQMGIYLASSLLIHKGDHVIAGKPGYFAADMVFQQAGGKLLGVPVDESGMDVDAVEALCKKKKIRMVYVIPHHHLPTTVTLTPDRRMRLLALANRYKFAILEDDYDFDLHYDFSPVLPMASQDYQGNVIYVGTLTKIFAPSIRIGFLVAPEKFIAAATHLRKIIDRQGDTILEEAVAALYSNGTITRHIKKVRNIYRERRDFLCDQLRKKLGDRVSFQVPQGGMSVWTNFIDNDLERVASVASKKGLHVSDSSLYNTRTKHYNASRLGFASLNLKELDEATTILKQALDKL